MSETAIENIEEVKSYTLRKLCADDIFPFCSIINQIGFKEFKACFESEESIGRIKKLMDGERTIDATSIGIPIAMDVAGIIFANIEKCKGSLYQLLSQLSGLTKDEIAALDLDVFMEMIIDVVKKEEFKSFFKAASKLFN